MSRIIAACLVSIGALWIAPSPAGAAEGQLFELLVSGPGGVEPPRPSLASSALGCRRAEVDWSLVEALAAPPPHRVTIPLTPGRNVTAVLTEHVEGTAPALVLSGKLEEYESSSVILATFEDAVTMTIEGPRYMRYTFQRRTDGLHSLCEWDPEKVRTGQPRTAERIPQQGTDTPPGPGNGPGRAENER
jgi:hypothetical protein